MPRCAVLDDAHDDLLVLPAAREQAVVEQTIDLLDEAELLVQREVAGQLVANDLQLLVLPVDTP